MKFVINIIVAKIVIRILNAHNSGNIVNKRDALTCAIKWSVNNVSLDSVKKCKNT